MEKFAGVREVIKVQTNAVQFADGSWLNWPPAASVRGTDNGFEIDCGTRPSSRKS